MMRMKVMVGAMTLAGWCSAAVAQEGKAEDGEQVFKKCQACHRIGPEAKNLIGPNLTGVLGRQAGTAEGFAYSELNKASGANGLVWTEALLLKYLEDPTPFLKEFLTSKGKADLASGATKMVFKLPDEQDRRDVIAYLKTFSPPK
jgi:cytochrome c